MLGHCAKVMKGGEYFLGMVFDFDGPSTEKIYITLSKGFRADIEWGEKFANHFNGTALIVKNAATNYACIQMHPFKDTDLCMGMTGWLVFLNTETHPVDIQECAQSHCHWANIVVIDKYSENINVLGIIPWPRTGMQKAGK